VSDERHLPAPVHDLKGLGDLRQPVEREKGRLDRDQNLIGRIERVPGQDPEIRRTVKNHEIVKLFFGDPGQEFAKLEVIIGHKAELFFEGIQAPVTGEKIEIRLHVPENLGKRGRNTLEGT